MWPPRRATCTCTADTVPVLGRPLCGYSKTVRLGIAQVLTVIRQQQKKALREAYANKVLLRTMTVPAPVPGVPGACSLS